MWQPRQPRGQAPCPRPPVHPAHCPPPRPRPGPRPSRPRPRIPHQRPPRTGWTCRRTAPSGARRRRQSAPHRPPCGRAPAARVFGLLLAVGCILLEALLLEAIIKVPETSHHGSRGQAAPQAAPGMVERFLLAFICVHKKHEGTSACSTRQQGPGFPPVLLFHDESIAISRSKRGLRSRKSKNRKSKYRIFFIATIATHRDPRNSCGASGPPYVSSSYGENKSTGSHGIARGSRAQGSHGIAVALHGVWVKVCVGGCVAT